MRYARYCWAMVVATVSVWTSIAHGGGIEVPMQSAAAAAQADAFTAQADDPSAIFYNPAGLTQLQGTQISVGVFFLQPEFHFEAANGGNERMGLPTVLPHFYIESDLGTDRWRVGFGANNVFGINEDWGSTGPLRDLVNKAQLEVISFSPTVAYKVDEHLSLGMAFNIYYGNLELMRNVPLGPGIPEGNFHLRGDNHAFGVTPAVMWKIDDHNTVAAYYRSPFSLDFNGHADLTLDGAALAGPSSAHERLNFPQSAGVAYAIKPIDTLKIEADVIWTDWHTVDQLLIHSSDPTFNGQTLPANWKSGFTYRLGAQYNLTEHWIFRGGYAYGQNSVPQSTFSPLIPDSNYHLFALGVGYQTPRWGIDLAGEYIFRERRHISGSADSPLVDGTWDNQMFGLMMTFAVRI